MQNKVTVTIDDQEYTLVASEDAAYMKKVAAYVSGKVAELRQGGKVSSADAAILAALNVADELFHSQEAAETLRAQIKESLEENKKLNMELSEAKRQIFKLQNQGKK